MRSFGSVTITPVNLERLHKFLTNPIYLRFYLTIIGFDRKDSIDHPLLFFCHIQDSSFVHMPMVVSEVVDAIEFLFAEWALNLDQFVESTIPT